MGKVFYYEGHKFEAIGNILGGWSKKTDCLYRTPNDSPIFETEHNEFYKVAKKNKASCDVYKVDDSADLYMPCCGKFWKVHVQETRFKRCEEYDKWYQ